LALQLAVVELHVNLFFPPAQHLAFAPLVVNNLNAVLHFLLQPPAMNEITTQKTRGGAAHLQEMRVGST
jgi:hypothetical protein